MNDLLRNSLEEKTRPSSGDGGHEEPSEPEPPIDPEEDDGDAS